MVPSGLLGGGGTGPLGQVFPGQSHRPASGSGFEAAGITWLTGHPRVADLTQPVCQACFCPPQGGPSLETDSVSPAGRPSPPQALLWTPPHTFWDGVL